MVALPEPQARQTIDAMLAAGCRFQRSTAALTHAEPTRIVAKVEWPLSVVEQRAAVVTTCLQRATRLRQAVLQKAFSGTLTLPSEL
jgi:hypothetical protein